jgi:Sec-independent protein translocase protein TatA
MPIEGIEWFIVSAIIIMMILWKPEKIGDIAKAFARVRIEFEKAQRDFQEMVTTTMREIESEDRRLIEVAKKLEIKTEGLTKEQIREEIEKKLKELSKIKPQVSSP